jgi:hypothetical protein
MGKPAFCRGVCYGAVVGNCHRGVAGQQRPGAAPSIHHKTAIFRQINLDNQHTHHDALEFPDGEVVLLTFLMEGQQATVLQLPASAGVKAPQQAEEPAIGG